MKERKYVHIISHTHWDREWYLPYEKHHVLLIQLMDNLLKKLQNDTDFKSFHLDGQTILLEDYLQVRPEKAEQLCQFITSGRLHIGPWYILQDEFLTSSEANVRNLQYGMKDARKWGNVAKIGYFPDSFGNMGQAPQILQQAGIHHAVFGRGVKPTGFNNTVSHTENYESPYSEMLWRSPDGSTVVGVLFANWYCNGNEIPVSKGEAQIYWDNHLENLEKYASSSHLLMMNGCDHQPIQSDLPRAIETAKSLYPDVTFIHSNFNDYVTSLSESLPKNLKVIDGELRSQQTDGWGTLVNTASARLYLKQMNHTCQSLLENVAEPLSAFSYLLGNDYPHHLLEYAWKTLMKNHPHDSICGCSVDEVHRGMVTRFENSQHVTEMVIQDSLQAITENIQTEDVQAWKEGTYPFAVFNTTGWERTGIVNVTLDVEKEYFSDGVNKQKLQDLSIKQGVVVDTEGHVFPCIIEDLGVVFDYELPEEKFRKPYMARRVRLQFEAKDIPALGYKTFSWHLIEKQGVVDCSSLITANNEMENDYIHVKINSNGSLSVKDKDTGRVFHDLCIYEDTGDVGNEYMYKQPNGGQAITTKDIQAKILVKEDTPYKAVFEIVHEWEIPKSATDLLEKEQKELVWFTARHATRSEKLIPMKLRTCVTLSKSRQGVDVETTFNNVAKDHRLRVLLSTDIVTDTHFADTVFEVVERDIQPAKEWKNPDYSQHQQAFVDVCNAEEGLTVANMGLPEYEILRDGRNTIAITLVRSVGEMGDWGYFPTPEAQCQGEHTTAFRIYPHAGHRHRMKAYKDAYQYRVPWSTQQLAFQHGKLPLVYSFIGWNSNSAALTSMKVSEMSGDVMLRWFQLSGDADHLVVNIPQNITSIYKSNVVETCEKPLEKINDHLVRLPIGAYEIVSIGLEKGERADALHFRN